MRAWCDIAQITSTKNLNGGLCVRSTAGLPFILGASAEGAGVRVCAEGVAAGARDAEGAAVRACATGVEGVAAGAEVGAAAGTQEAAGCSVFVVPPPLELPRCLTVARVCEQDDVRGTGVVYFNEVSDIESAKEYVGCHCLMRREAVQQVLSAGGASAVEKLSALDAFDAHDGAGLAGWSVFDAHAGFVGRIIELRDMPGQVILVVSAQDSCEILIPLVSEFIERIDEEAREISLNLPRGLLEL